MKKSDFKKMGSLRVKRIYCPICRKWYENEGEFPENLHKCFAQFRFFLDEDMLYISPIPLCGRLIVNETDKIFLDIELDENCVYANVKLERCVITCDGPYVFCDNCENFFNGRTERTAQFKLEYDPDDLVKVGIYPNEKNHEEKVAENISVKEVKEKGIEDSKNESVVTKGFDLKAVANDLGVINTDARIKSTVLGTVFEYESGLFRGFDRESGVIIDYPNIKPINLPSIIIPATSVKKGEMVLHNDEFYFITKAEDEEVMGVNPKTLIDVRLLPVDNPIGIKCYTKVISLGEVLGFNGETTQNTTIIWWVATMMAQKLCDGGVDLTNENIKEKSNKYIELLLPFTSVAFAAYVANGENMKGKDISEIVKKTFGIDMTELIIRKILKDWLV